jgi:Icc-related predicted phosphoesterase
MTKIVCISDTHGFKDFSIPPGDILIHAGDAMNTGTEKDLINMSAWFGNLSFKHIIYVPGNHDTIFEDDYHYAKLILPENVTLLIDQETVIDGIRFYGTPYQPEFCNWAFNLPRGPQLIAKWDLIPIDTDILITHSPAYGYGDDVSINKSNPNHIGCQDLQTKLLKLTNTKYHIHGHCHAGYGIYKNNHITTINAAICNEQYKPVQLPITINL